ncbi:MAG: DUF805 domain-containing protein [Dehalococcoidia bacterium]
MVEEPNFSGANPRYCGQCGNILGPESRFCPRCGSAADAPEAPVPFTTPEDAAPPAGHEFRWSNALNPSGRFNRLEFLLFLLGPYLVAMLLFYVVRPLGMIFLVFALYIIIVAYIRRFHDLDRSGWFTLLALVPIVSLVVLLVLLFFPGTRGANRWGT